MIYESKFQNEDRIIKLISEIAEINPENVREAVNKYGLKEILVNPTIISEKAADKLKDLQNFISYVNQGE